MLTRRSFLTATAQAGGLVALGGLTTAADLFAAPADDASKVIIVSTNDRAAGIRQAIKLFDKNPFSGKNVVLKPNFNSDDPFPGSTHPITLETMITELANMGAWRITVADRSGMSGGNTRKVMENLGVFTLGRKLNFETVVLNELSENQYTPHNSRDWHWQRGFYMPTLFHRTDVIVQTCCLKTHQFGGHFSMSLKNSVGMVAKRIGKTGSDYMTELHQQNLTYQRHMIAEINQVYTPTLIVMDAMEAFVDGGPHRGPKKKPGVIVAGSDRVAIDAVGVAILRMYNGNTTISTGPIFELDQIKRAVELDIGVRSAAQIRLVTEPGDTESEAFVAKLRMEL